MNKLEMARKYDRGENLIEAAKAYDEAFPSDEATLDDYLNAALVNFEMNDFGMASHLHLPPGAEAHAYDRATELLNQAENRFGKCSEIDFWRLYFPFSSLGDELTVKQVEEISNRDTSLVPFMFLYGHEGYENPREVVELRKRMADRNTARKRHILTLLDSATNLQRNRGMKYLVK